MAKKETGVTDADCVISELRRIGDFQQELTGVLDELKYHVKRLADAAEKNDWRPRAGVTTK